MRRLGWFFGVFLYAADLASATSITSGEFQFGPGTQFGPGFGTFVLIGDTVNISGEVTSVLGRIPDFVCNPLNGLDCTISLSAASVFSQIVGVQGNDEKESLLEFVAPVRTITEAGVVTAPFTFAGKYCLTDPADRNLPVVPCLTYYDNLVGAGTVFFTVTPFTAVVRGETLALLRSGGARYVFESPQTVPVPEPATILLVASGLSAASWRRWRKRR